MQTAPDSPIAPADTPKDRWPRGLRLLASLAFVVIIVAGLRAAAAFFVPVAVALLASIACVPLVRRLERLGIREGLAILFVLVVVGASILFIALVLGTSLDRLTAALPEYRDRFEPLIADLTQWLQRVGLHDIDPSRVLDADALMTLIVDTTRALVGFLSNIVVVLLLMIFTLLEARGLPRKLEAAFGRPDAARTFEQVVERIGRYLGVKALMCLLTGVCIGVLNAAMGVNHPVLLGFVAFAFNFVPNVGSIIAAVPAIALAWTEHGFGAASLIIGGYLVINFSISNGLEPHVMGTRLGISTLVVFLSLIFWFWVWGPVGMILSVPMTAILKIVLEHSDEYRPIAVLLGRGG